MLLRFYRLTDKLGVLLLKASTEFVNYLLFGVGQIVGGALLDLFYWLRRAFYYVRTRITGRRLSLPMTRRNPNAKQPRASGTTAPARSMSAFEIRTTVTEDPLRTQNRTLSILVVVMLFAMIGVFIWATAPGRQPALRSNPNAVSLNPFAANNDTVPLGADDPTPTLPSLVDTPIPTSTAIPDVLLTGGSIVYVARERGQDDIWAVDVLSSTAIRLTNDPADERDPVWSPDGRRLAYSSRKDGNWEIYVYDLLTREEERLTFDLSFQGSPSWSPDGAFLVYESYQGNNLDLYVVPVDSSQPPIRLTEHPEPDFSPAWSPDGRRIAFVSWRSGNQDIYVYDLDDPRDAVAVNITNSPSRNEQFPVWSPVNNEILAYSAVDEGREVTFVQPFNVAGSIPQVIGRGRAPAWSPDGTSILVAVDSGNSTQLIAEPFAVDAVTTRVIPVLLGATNPSWTQQPLPAAYLNEGGLPMALPDPLFIEQEVFFEEDPPYRLDTLVSVDAPNPVLSDRVNDSFNALREQANSVIGYDFLGTLEDAFWPIDRPPQPGEDRRNWHMAGRAFAINRNLIAGFPPPIEVVREDIGVNTVWRVFVRVSEDAQNGQLGEPLRVRPWDFAARQDVEGYDQGGRYRDAVPEGYYIDLTQLVADFGWSRVPAGSDWTGNFNSRNYWVFHQRSGLTWFEAMRELYTEGQMGGFAPTQTPTAGN